MTNKRPVLALIAVVLFCASLSSPSLALAAAVNQWKGELPIRQPWLRDHLPDDALVYARVPHPLGLLTMPKGNSLDPALRSKVNVENIIKIREGISDNILSQIPAFASVHLRLLEQHLRSPLEVAAFIGAAPSVVISVNLSLDSNAAFEEVLDLMGVSLLEPLDAQGYGAVGVVPMPTYVRFDASSGQLLILAGPAVTEQEFENLIDGTRRDSPHRMRQMESRIDDSGQGLFLWVDSERALPLLEATLPAEQVATLTASGLNKVSSASFGWGVANGKGRFSLLADLPADGDRGFLPNVKNKLSARTVGSPDGLFLMSIPTAEEFTRLEALAMQLLEPESQDDWFSGKDEVKDALGVSIEEFLQSVGPEVMVILDDAGDYSAIRLRDAKLWDSIVERLSDKAGNKPDERRISGNTYYHIGMPNQFGLLDESDAEELGWLAVLARRMEDHIYWTHDGDFMYLASIPQVLVDRATMRPDTNVSDWFENQQRIDADTAIISISGSSEKLPRRLYASYIEIIQLVADIGEADVDIWSMPTAAQLGLPERGALGFTLSLGDPTLAMELTFENNPLEMLGGVGGFATAGILAAIAIPAYQDYTVRARISKGLSLSAGLKADVSDYYFSNGTFPDTDAAAAMEVSTEESDEVTSITVEANTGNIIIAYAESVAGGGEVILYSSIDSDGSVRWKCGATFENKHLPATCRSDDEVDLEDGDT